MNTAKLKAVPRHSVDGYGRQDISYNDPEGEFVFYSDYEALKDALEAAHKRIAELEARTVKLPSINPQMFNDDVMFGYRKAQREAVEFCAAAGINLETGGEA
ncbi:hypothetical protein QMS90_17655 [Cronobacter sakazakii]|uniref:hypothetical protein n=1 Tax=Cronobacter sakazakii TaxID=28141 RepID=UPI0009489F33|nr:hypothetical protein [Cronobacter sakazakii]